MGISVINIHQRRSYLKSDLKPGPPSPKCEEGARPSQPKLALRNCSFLAGREAARPKQSLLSRTAGPLARRLEPKCRGSFKVQGCGVFGLPETPWRGGG